MSTSMSMQKRATQGFECRNNLGTNFLNNIKLMWKGGTI